jgi:hypothetical protein
MDVTIEDGKERRWQRWRSTAAAVGGDGRRWCLMAAMDDGEGGGGDSR